MRRPRRGTHGTAPGCQATAGAPSPHPRGLGTGRQARPCPAVLLGVPCPDPHRGPVAGPAGEVRWLDDRVQVSPSLTGLAGHAGTMGRQPATDPAAGAHRVKRAGGGRPRTSPGHHGGDKAYSPLRNRLRLRRRLWRSRFDKRDCVFHGTVTAAALRLRLRCRPAAVKPECPPPCGSAAAVFWQRSGRRCASRGPGRCSPSAPAATPGRAGEGGALALHRAAEETAGEWGVSDEADAELFHHAADDVLTAMWDPAAPGSTSVPLGHHDGGASALAALPDGRVASGGARGQVLVWDPAAPDSIRRPTRQHPGQLRSAARRSPPDRVGRAARQPSGQWWLRG